VFEVCMFFVWEELMLIVRGNGEVEWRERQVSTNGVLYSVSSSYLLV
jgi:hypothetical protein